MDPIVKVRKSKRSAVACVFRKAAAATAERKVAKTARNLTSIFRSIIVEVMVRVGKIIYCRVLPTTLHMNARTEQVAACGPPPPPAARAVSCCCIYWMVPLAHLTPPSKPMQHRF